MSRLPFRHGSPEDFSAVRDLLEASGYTTDAVCGRAGIHAIEEFRTVAEGRTTGAGLDDSLDALIRLFMDGAPVPTTALEALLPAPGVAALERLRLIARHPSPLEAYAATVRLYPTRGVYVASDLDTEAPGVAEPDELEPPDHVFSAITTLTGTFLRQLPSTPCDRFLELCAGTGIAALAASRVAGHVWAADITERSTKFAEFNALLNGIDNFSAVEGDLYDPVRGLTFDRIAAHPPYVPATEIRMVYRDGGEDGEEVIRRILGQLPDFLETGGEFHLTCVASDRAGAPLEQRIREMIGEAEQEFDLLLVTHYLMSPGEYYGRLAASGRISYTLAEERTFLFRQLQAEQIVYCSATLRRHGSERAPFTLRRERREGSEAAEAEWLLRWSTRVAEEDVAGMLLDSRPRLLPHARLHVTHRVEQGEWKVDNAKVMVEYPYVRTVDLSLNAAMLLTLCDGEHTVREILARIQAAGAIPSEVPEAAFAEFIRELVTEGVLGVGGEPRPAAPGPAASVAAGPAGI
jgi:SAM-dependent methyltransferase